MKKALIILIVLLIALVLFMFNSNESTTKVQTKNIGIEAIDTIDVPLVNTNTPQPTTEEEKIENDAEESYPQHQNYSIFEELDIDDTQLNIKPKVGVKPITALRMKKNTIKEIELGDSILLPSIDGNTYELTITHKEVSPRGNVSIDGSFSENGINYSAILTEGSNAAFVSMNTPEGTFEIELLNGIGYVYANSDIDKAKIDYSKSDEVKMHKEEH